MSTRILLVDDHQLFRQGLTALLRGHPTLEIVAECNDVPEAEAAVRTSLPDVVVLDLGLPGASGLSLARALQKSSKRPRILVLSMKTDEESVAEALDSGVAGFASKEDSAEQVRDAIVKVAAGGTYLTPRISHSMLDEYLRRRGERKGTQGPLSALTAREREIFELVVRGLTTTTIATQLAVSPRTVETHRRRILQKLGLHTAADLVRFAAQRGLLRS